MILNEKLFENKTLNEKFSDSMPKWLQDRLLFFKYVNERRRSSAKGDAFKQKYTDRGFNLDDQHDPTQEIYKRGSYGRGRWQSGYGARGPKTNFYDVLRAQGLDLDSAEFIEGPVPTSNRDPRLKEPNIPIYLLKDPDSNKTQVYMPGVNDNEKFAFNDEDKTFKYIRPKELLDYCVGFCYIDGSDKSNFTTRDKRGGRADYKAFDKTDPFKRWTPEEQKEYNAYRWRDKADFDKAGHLIDPTILKDRLYKYKAQHPDRVLDKLYRRISNIKNDFSQIYASADINDKDNQEFLDVFSNGLNERLMRIISSYNYTVQLIKDILDSSEYDQEQKERLINNRLVRDVQSIEANISDLEKDAENVLSVDLDWD